MDWIERNKGVKDDSEFSGLSNQNNEPASVEKEDSFRCNRFWGKNSSSILNVQSLRFY